MAWFLCNVGSGGLELTVTCDSVFAGTTITCTDGTATLTKTCPSSSPYVVKFSLPNDGTWTVSGTYSGETYSTSATIDTDVDLTPVPNGATVTPTDDIQTWLHCANIWDKNYTTLDEVLADSTTLLALISSNNAVDYMARSTTWATNTGLVPTMTSNTTPSGKCTSVNTLGTGSAYNAFDDNNSSLIQPSQAPLIIGYTFPSATKVSKVSIVSTSADRFPTSFKIQSATDSTLSNRTDIKEVAGSGTSMDIVFDSPVESTSFCLYDADAQGTAGWCRISALQFYAMNKAITEDSTAMTMIGANNYCADTLLSDSTWLNAICNSSYFESVLNVKVPTMTSNTAPSGQCFASGTYSGYQIWKAFNGTNTNGDDCWLGNANHDVSIGYMFTSEMAVHKIDVINRNSSTVVAIKNFKLQGSNTGNSNDYTDITTLLNPSSSQAQKSSFAINNATKYKYLRIYVVDSYSSSAYTGGNFQFYGRV